MKKLLLLAFVSLAFISCDKQDNKTQFKTAYVNYDTLMKKYQKTIDVEEKYKVKSEEMGRELESDAKKFQNDYAYASQQAQAKGPQWAQQKVAELQRREQELGVKQQSMLKEIQDASSKEMDSIIKDVEKFIKDFGKKNGYDYIYATSSVPSILYAKDSYDITNQMVEAINKTYTPNKDSKTSDKK